jgi:hypothetical protein
LMLSRKKAIEITHTETTVDSLSIGLPGGWQHAHLFMYLFFFHFDEKKRKRKGHKSGWGCSATRSPTIGKMAYHVYLYTHTHPLFLYNNWYWLVGSSSERDGVIFLFIIWRPYSPELHFLVFGFVLLFLFSTFSIMKEGEAGMTKGNRATQEIHGEKKTRENPRRI